jgi:cytidylate kinase
MIVAIDGPSGSGKTTVAKEVSKRLGFSTLDTGAMYRAVTYRGLQKGFDLANIENLDEDDSVSDIRKELVRIANEEPIEFEYDNQGQPIKVTIGGQDVTREIRTPEVDRTVSVVSACSDVRKALVEQQREMGSKTDTVLEGRDIGTVVFPMPTSRSSSPPHPENVPIGECCRTRTAGWRTWTRTRRWSLSSSVTSSTRAGQLARLPRPTMQLR